MANAIPVPASAQMQPAVSAQMQPAANEVCVYAATTPSRQDATTARQTKVPVCCA